MYKLDGYIHYRKYSLKRIDFDPRTDTRPLRCTPCLETLLNVSHELRKPLGKIVRVRESCCSLLHFVERKSNKGHNNKREQAEWGSVGGVGRIQQVDWGHFLETTRVSPTACIVIPNIDLSHYFKRIFSHYNKLLVKLRQDFW